MQTRPRRIREELLDHGWWLVPLVFVVWFVQLQLPTPEPGPDLDESWHAVKGWELLTVVRLGIDSIFTYGRLGWFHDAPEVSQLFWWKLAGFEFAFKLALAALCGLAVLRTSGVGARVVFALALLSVAGGLDAFAFVALLAGLRHVLDARERRAGGELGVLVLLALLAHVKFTYFLLWAACLALGFAALWADASLRRALGFLARGAGSFGVLWLLFGQSPAGFIDWLQSSWWIASGYNEALSAAGSMSELVLGIALLAGCLLLVLLEALRAQPGARPRALLLLGFGACLLAWRTSFTRQLGNTDAFFAVAPAAVCFALAPRAGSARALGLALTLGRALLLGAGLYGLAHTHPLRDATLAQLVENRARAAAEKLRDLADPIGLRERDSIRGAEIAAEWDLPKVRARIEQDTLDVFQNSQGVALLNGFNFHPRPVFQSYSAYTPELLARNAEFYAGERAPFFALYRIEPIDGRLAAAEDAKALDELLLRYRLCFEERGWLLLERAEEELRPHSDEPLALRSCEFGEWIDLASPLAEALELRLDPRPSARGRVETLLLRGPALGCEFERADGSRGRARLVPGAARAGFLARPFIENEKQLSRVFLGLPVPGLVRLRVLASEGEEALWEPRFDATLIARKGLLPPLRREEALAFEYSDFAPPPAEVASAEPVREVQQDGREVHVFRAPAALRWKLEPGRYQLTGNYGMLDSAWKEEVRTDGALVFVMLQQGREQKLLFRRLLEPQKKIEDQGTQPMQLEFELSEPAELYVRMRVGWYENDVRDWIFWDGLRIERL